MEWLDRAYDTFSRYHRDTQAARNGAESVYQNLWARIVEVVNAANEKDMQLTTNGLPHSRVVAMPLGREARREVVIALNQDEQLITVESDAGAMALQIGVDDTQVVCLLLNGKILSAEQAAQKIMEGFLFGARSPFAIPAPPTKSAPANNLAAQAQRVWDRAGDKLKNDPHYQAPY